MKVQEYYLAQEMLKTGQQYRPNSTRLTERRNRIVSEMLSIYKRLRRSARDEIINQRPIRPLVVGVGGKVLGARASFLYPNAYESQTVDHAYQLINKELLLTEAEGAVRQDPGEWVYEGSEEKVDCLYFSLQTAGWKRLIILPYEIKDGTVTWHYAIRSADFDDRRVTIYNMN